MKAKLLLLFLVLFLIPACQNYDQPLEPESPSGTKQFLSMPAKSDNIQIEEIFSAHKFVSGINGDTIVFNFSYISNTGSPVKIYGTLVIPPGSFNDETDFTLLVDQNQTYIDFYPSPKTFDSPVILDLTYEGLDLNGIDSDKIDFYYIGDSNNYFEVARKNKKLFDAKSGTISIVGAVIPHFSRWGVGND